MATLASVSERPSGSVGQVGGALAPPATPRRRSAFAARISASVQRLWWTLVSIGTFTVIWELCWLTGLADPKLLPPPHIFLGNIAEQAKLFNTATRWSIGVNPADGPSPYEAVMITIGATTMRVMVGLVIASVLAISLGVLISIFPPVRAANVAGYHAPLSPVSPIAWLPVAIFLFGIGNAPAIFMVVIALFFHMVLATISQIDGVNRNLINVARTMGATKWQTYSRVDHPGNPAWAAGGATDEPVCGLDGGSGGGIDRRRLWARSGNHDGAQHVQPVACVLHHRPDRAARLHV